MNNKTLTEQIEQLRNDAAEIKAKYPAIHDVTFHIDDADYNEMKELAKNKDNNLDYSPAHGKMRFLESFYDACIVTIVAVSKPVKARNMIVFEEETSIAIADISVHENGTVSESHEGQLLNLVS